MERFLAGDLYVVKFAKIEQVVESMEKKKNYVGIEALPTSIKEKESPRA